MRTRNIYLDTYHVSTANIPVGQVDGIETPATFDTSHLAVETCYPDTAISVVEKKAEVLTQQQGLRESYFLITTGIETVTKKQENVYGFCFFFRLLFLIIVAVYSFCFLFYGFCVTILFFFL